MKPNPENIAKFLSNVNVSDVLTGIASQLERESDFSERKPRVEALVSKLLDVIQESSLQIVEIGAALQMAVLSIIATMAVQNEEGVIAAEKLGAWLRQGTKLGTITTMLEMTTRHAPDCTCEDKDEHESEAKAFNEKMGDLLRNIQVGDTPEEKPKDG